MNKGTLETLHFYDLRYITIKIKGRPNDPFVKIKKEYTKDILFIELELIKRNPIYQTLFFWEMHAAQHCEDKCIFEFLLAWKKCSYMNSYGCLMH